MEAGGKRCFDRYFLTGQPRNMLQDATNTLSQRYIICFLDTIENLKATTTNIIIFTSNNVIKFVLFENSNSGRVVP